MALHILKDSMKKLPDRYEEYATVQSLQRIGLKKFFGPRAGTVRVSLPKGAARPVFQVVAPEWKGGQSREWELLRQSYENVLLLAEERRCKAVVIPLLTADNPDFPGYIDYKIAVDTIREFLENHILDVFLLVSRQDAVQMPELRKDVEKFLSRNFFEDIPRWSNIPFAQNDSRFATIVPGVTEPSFDMRCDFDEYCDSDDSYDFGAPPCVSKYSHCEDYGALCPPSTGFSRNTGALPKIPNLDHLDAGFSETLLKLIDKTGKKDSEIYNKANVSRQHFSKIRNNPDYKPTKPTAIAFAIALELDMEQTRDLIGRAGYALTNSSKFDVIIMYFIHQRNYNMFDINEILYEYDQSLLGA